MRKKEKRKRTKTSSFGSSGREGHDSTPFYTSKLYEVLPTEEKGDFLENPIPSNFLDRIFTTSSEKMTELPDSSIHLMVTSPPIYLLVK